MDEIGVACMRVLWLIIGQISVVTRFFFCLLVDFSTSLVDLDLPLVDSTDGHRQTRFTSKIFIKLPIF
jgi:hypothetical protein